MRIDSSAPTRIDLAGGTLDIWPLYLFHQPAVTVNAAIDLRATCRIEPREDGRLALVSVDTGEHLEAARAADLPLDRLPLVARLARHFDAAGATITTRSDSPVGAGIAGSSAMTIAVIAALAAWTRRAMDDEALFTLAMNVEAQVLGVPTGGQDYRPARYGGVSAVELDVTGVRRVASPVDAAALESRLVLAYTGASRNSGINNWDVMKRHIDGDAAVASAFDRIARTAGRMRAAIDRSDWPAVARALRDEWSDRKRLAPGVTTPTIDALFDAATAAGALAGKVCGAGGGGCLFCLTPPERRAEVAAALSSAGAQVLPCRIDQRGLVVDIHPWIH